MRPKTAWILSSASSPAARRRPRVALAAVLVDPDEPGDGGGLSVCYVGDDYCDQDCDGYDSDCFPCVDDNGACDESRAGTDEDCEICDDSDGSCDESCVGVDKDCFPRGLVDSECGGEVFARLRAAPPARPRAEVMWRYPDAQAAADATSPKYTDPHPSGLGAGHAELAGFGVTFIQCGGADGGCGFALEPTVAEGGLRRPRRPQPALL